MSIKTGVRSKHMRNYEKTLTNKLPFKNENFISEKYNGVNIITIPAGFHVFHGTTANTNLEKQAWLNDIINNNMSQALRQNFFIADKTTASIYGTLKDTSSVVLSLDPRNVKASDNIVSSKQIIPLYYIPGSHGIDIEFIVVRPLRLINMNDKNTLTNIILKAKEYARINDDNFDYRDSLNTAFAKIKKNLKWNPHAEDQSKEFYLDEIFKVHRDSLADTDQEVAQFLCTILPNFIKTSFDGWIYFGAEKESTFHGELMLCKPNEYILQYVQYHSVPDTIYPPQLLSIDEFQRLMPSYNDLKQYQIKYVRAGYSIKVRDTQGGQRKPKSKRNNKK